VVRLGVEVVEDSGSRYCDFEPWPLEDRPVDDDVVTVSFVELSLLLDSI